METSGVQRQKSYLRARPCLFRPRVETREPLEVHGDMHPRSMIAHDRIRLISAANERSEKLRFFASERANCLWLAEAPVQRKTPRGVFFFYSLFRLRDLYDLARAAGTSQFLLLFCLVRPLVNNKLRVVDLGEFPRERFVCFFVYRLVRSEPIHVVLAR